MRHNLLMLALLAMTAYACTGVSVYRHPDYNFPPTDPNQIRYYTQDQQPVYPYLIIGKIAIDATWTVSMAKAEQKVGKLAARAGADGIIITEVDVDIWAFNQYITVQGYSSGDAYTAFITPHANYLVTKVLYGYLIKRTGQ